MALIKCAECGKEISDKAKECPNCGYRNKKNISVIIILAICLCCGIFLICNVFNIQIGNSNNETPIYGVYTCLNNGVCKFGNEIVLSENGGCSLPDRSSIQNCNYTLSGNTIYINYTINGYANGQLDGSYNSKIFIENNNLIDENGYTYSKN